MHATPAQQFRFSFLPLLFVWFVLFSAFAEDALAQTVAGTVIANQAVLTYTDNNTGEATEVVSNVATIYVSALLKFSIRSQHDIVVSAGQQVHLTHELSNEGNVADSYQFRIVADHLSSVRAVRDVNRNGLAEANEPELTGVVHLAPGAKMEIVVAASIPRESLPGDVFDVSIEVTNASASVRHVVDTISVEPGLQLSLVKTSNVSCLASLFPGDELWHLVELENLGGDSVQGIQLLVDGEKAAGIVVEHRIPAGLGFVDVEYQGSAGFAVIRLAGVAANSWITLDEWDGSTRVQSAGVLYLEGSLAPLATDEFKVQTAMVESISQPALAHTYVSVDTDGDGHPDFESNRTCHQLSSTGAASEALAILRFVEPSPSVKNRGGIADFYTDTDYTSAVQYPISTPDTPLYNTPREGVYLEMTLANTLSDSSNVKYDRDNQRFIEVTLQSSASGDRVIVLLLETDIPGSFRSIAPVKLSTNERANGAHCPLNPGPDTVLRPDFQQSSQHCVLESDSADQLLATYKDAGLGFVVAEVSLVNPQALVFNAQTLLPVSGAKITFINAEDDRPLVNPATGLPYNLITGSQGLYSMPRLEPLQQYYIEVEPPSGHVFPSQKSTADMAAFNVLPASYGRAGFQGVGNGKWYVEIGHEFTPLDIPLDSAVGDTLLMVDKNVLIDEVSIGDIVTYTITVKNHDTRALSSLTLLDRPPYGYRYVAMSGTLNDEALRDPMVSESGELVFDLGALASGQSANVSYSLRVSAAALDSDGINTATAVAVTEDNARVISPEARVQTKLSRTDVLSDTAALFGKIYVDQNCNDLHDHAEWPVGGVRMYLQDGTFTVSDADGSYSLYGLSPGTHVIKVDSHTLPGGLRLKPIHSTQAADPYSRFVELRAGDFFRADFAAMCPEQSEERLFSEIKARNGMLNGEWILKDVTDFRTDVKPVSDTESRIKSVDGDLSNGIVRGPTLEPGSAAIASISPELVKKIAASQRPASAPLPDPKKIVVDITNAQAKAGVWLWPKTQISTRGRFMAVIRDGIEPTLYVNGAAVPASHIGERLANRREKAQVVAWYGVELAPGENKVEVKGVGPFGNERILATGNFKKPSSGVAIQLQPESNSIEADNGRTTLPVKIEIVDEFGYPALGVYFVTLESTDGGWVEEDIQNSEPGIQVRVSNGERVVHYTSSSNTGEVKLTARTGEFSDEATIQQITESRPLIAVGLIEAGVGFSNTHFGEFAPSRSLKAFSSGARLDSRTAVFAKGRIKDQLNLTLSYDSDKSSQALLMRDIDPSAHYPVHGDASVRGFDAQSRSKLYVKLEEEKSSLMWGDFQSDNGSQHEDLARIRRTLTGFNSVIDSDYGRFQFFLSRQRDNHKIEEFPGNGSAMLYRLDAYPIVTHSEVVELVTRSRENPGLIIARSRLTRFVDYSIDPVFGYISFSSVVPTVDDRQNPVFVQINYDVKDDGNQYVLSGIRFDRTVNANLQLGFSHTIDAHSLTGVNRTGAYATVKSSDNTQLKLSVAGSDSVNGDNGLATRVSVDHRWSEHSRTSLTYARADKEFSNSGASIASGREEARIHHNHKIAVHTSASIDALYSGSVTSDEGRTSLSAQIESRLRKWLVRAGLRQVTQQSLAGSDKYVTALAGVDRQFTLGEKPGQFNVEIEQDIEHASRRRVAIGGKLQMHQHARVYSNYELSNSLLALAGISSDQQTELLTLGVETDVLPNARMYSEYRMRGAFDHREHAAATGIRADFEIEPDLRISPNVEVIDGGPQQDSIAASIAVTDTRTASSRRLMRLETRRTHSSDYLGLKASYAARIDDEWTGLLTENLTRQDNLVGEDSLRHSLVAGFSKRPRLNNRHHMLFMYNWKEEEGVSPGVRRSMHMLSTHQNLQLDSQTILSGRLGGKRQKHSLRSSKISDFSLLADVRLNFDVNPRVNIDLHGGVLATDNMSEIKYSAGAGVYYVVNKNVRIGVGYNFGGFRDEDLDIEEYHAQGMRFGFQYKFDEDSLKWLE